VGGGYANTASGQNAFIGGGEYNTDSGNAGTIGGGQNNTIGNAFQPTVGGGYGNNASANYATVAGGNANTASGTFATVPGGEFNQAKGSYSLACGYGAIANAANTFVWADGQASSFSSGGTANSFNIRATGGVWFWTAANSSGAGTGGAELAQGATAWTALSDRNAKKNFQPVNVKGVLDKLAAIPIEQWNYKWEKDSAVPNIGPMAQDFKHAFFPGRDDKGISTLEFDGVELAAIQGLNQKMEEKDAEIQDLKQSVDELKKLVQSLAAKNGAGK
jgi:hypothetical protein